MGVKLNDTSRWIDLGFITFQPSEGLKIGTIMVLARAMESRQAIINDIKIIPTTLKIKSKEFKDVFFNNTLPLLGPVILACGAILPAHTSSAAIVFLTSLIMLYIGSRCKTVFQKAPMVCRSLSSTWKNLKKQKSFHCCWR